MTYPTRGSGFSGIDEQDGDTGSQPGQKITSHRQFAVETMSSGRRRFDNTRQLREQANGALAVTFFTFFLPSLLIG